MTRTRQGSVGRNKDDNGSAELLGGPIITADYRTYLPMSDISRSGSGGEESIVGQVDAMQGYLSCFRLKWENIVTLGYEIWTLEIHEILFNEMMEEPDSL